MDAFEDSLEKTGVGEDCLESLGQLEDQISQS